MAKKTDRPSLKETAVLHLRCYRDIDRLCPGLLLSWFLHALVYSAIPYVTIYFSAQIINALASGHNLETLWFWVALTVGVEAGLALVKALLYRWRNARFGTFERRRKLLFEKLLSMDYADADKQENRDMLHQILQNEQWGGWGWMEGFFLYEYLVQGIVGIVSAIALTVSLFTLPVPPDAGVLTWLNHPAFLAVLLVIMAGVTVVGPLSASMTTAAEAALADEARLGNRIFGAFGYMGSDQSKAMDLRMYNQIDLAQHYLLKELTFCVDGPLDRLMKGKVGIINALASGSSAVFTGIVYVFVCLKAWAGAFGVGSITQYVGAVTALSKNVSLLVQTIGYLRANATFLRTAYQFLDIPNSMYQGSLTTEKRSDRQYEVEFRDVSFKYPGTDRWALRKVNMKFKVGKRLAIVGENGSGKTTFIKLLCRLYDPQEGQILLNGIDIRKYNYREYMDIFSVVFQDFQLIAQPLGNNVSGSAEYDRARAEKALMDAGFGDRLSTMPRGLNTMLYKDIDENGVEISGGEAQKIAIARALYKDSPFIILDEPTAALDPIAEAEIYSKFNDIAGDKTAIYISHRLSSCKFCDEIAVFHNGAVIQQGSHETLVAQTEGKYHQLWQAQAQYYTKDGGEREDNT